MLDHSFPRSEEELHYVSNALGEIQYLLEQERIAILFPDALCERVLDFCWDSPRPYSLLNEIYRLLSSWILQTHGIERVELLGISDAPPHPIPDGDRQEGLVDTWAHELGKVLVLHEACTNDSSYHIGVACERAFSGLQVRQYDAAFRGRAFPLMGPESIGNLTEAYAWADIPDNATNLTVHFRQAEKHINLLGATKITPPSGGSHYKVHFPGHRPWILDKNVDPLPDRFLKQLEPITGLSLCSIKAVLVTGKRPKRRVLRIRQLQT